MGCKKHKKIFDANLDTIEDANVDAIVEENVGFNNRHKIWHKSAQQKWIRKWM